MEKEEQLRNLKAEIFDLQVDMSLIKEKLKLKVVELNRLNGKSKPEIEV